MSVRCHHGDTGEWELTLFAIFESHTASAIHLLLQAHSSFLQGRVRNAVCTQCVDLHGLKGWDPRTVQLVSMSREWLYICGYIKITSSHTTPALFTDLPVCSLSCRVGVCSEHFTNWPRLACSTWQSLLIHDNCSQLSSISPSGEFLFYPTHSITHFF